MLPPPSPSPNPLKPHPIIQLLTYSRCFRWIHPLSSLFHSTFSFPPLPSLKLPSPFPSPSPHHLNHPLCISQCTQMLPVDTPPLPSLKLPSPFPSPSPHHLNHPLCISQCTQMPPVDTRFVCWMTLTSNESCMAVLQCPLPMTKKSIYQVTPLSSYVCIYTFTIANDKEINLSGDPPSPFSIYIPSPTTKKSIYQVTPLHLSIYIHHCQ